MPTLPTAENMPMSVPRPATGVAQSADVGGLFNTLSNVAQGIEQNIDQFDYAKARSNFLTQKVNIESEINNDADWKSAPQTYAQKMNEARQSSLSMIRSPRMANQFKLETDQEYATGLSQVSSMVHAKTMDEGRGDLENMIDQNSNAALTSPNDAPALLATTNMAIDGAANKGMISQAEAVKLKHITVKNYGQNWLALQKPEDIIKSLTGSEINKAEGDISAAILGQESGNRDNIKQSPQGAVGPGQIMPGTFQQYAKPGENINNPKDNRAVHDRIINDLSQKYAGDPARVAVGYFSGPGNVAPEGSPTPWLNDTADKTGKHVSDYVSDVMTRLQGAAPDENNMQIKTFTGTPADFLDPIQKQQALKGALAEWRQNQSLAKQQRAAQASQTATQLLTGIATGQASVKDILNSGLPAFGENSINELLTVAGKMSDGVTSPGTFQNLYEKIHLPNGDKNKITSPSQIRSFVGNGLSMADANKLVDEVQGRGTDEGSAISDMKKGLYDIAKAKLVKSSPVSGLFDPNDSVGQEQLQKFRASFDRQYQAGLQAHKTPEQMLTPGSKDYLGNMIGQFVISPDQRMKMNMQKSVSPVQTQPAQNNKQASGQKQIQNKARSPGETPEAYLKRIGL